MGDAMRPLHVLSSQSRRAAGRRRTTRRLLALLALISAAIGAYALLAPHSFYRHVLGVDLLGPYNQHLLTDVGGFYLGFAVLFAWAATTLSRGLVRASCVAWLVTQSLHFLYHALHLAHFTGAQAVVQTIGLAALLVLPAAIIASSTPHR
jgi:hypothetical protein